MSQETYNVVITLFSFLAVVGSIVNFIVNRIELHAQRKATRELAKLTSDLETQVHRLTREMDYRTMRLNRARELMKDIHVAYQRMGAFAYLQLEIPDVDAKDLFMTMRVTQTELNALVLVIDDTELITAFDVVDATITKSKLEGDKRQVIQQMGDVQMVIVKFYQRLYKLLADVHRQPS